MRTSASLPLDRQPSYLAAMRFEGAVLLAYLFGLAILLGLTLWLNGGRFAYTLDDAYVHLALAENIPLGHYGLNLEEPSSPSSSILWPFLLAPLAHLEHFELVPLMLNVVCMLGTLLLLTRSLRAWLGPLLSPGSVVVVLFLVALCCNFWGMPFNGMEHCAQLLMTTWVAVGLIDLVENRRASPTLLAGLVLGPLLRFENLSLLVMGAVVLALQRCRIKALLVLGVSVALIAAYSAFLLSQGESYLPSSVLVKSGVASAGSGPMWLLEVGENLLESLFKSRISASLVMLILLLKRIRSNSDSVQGGKDRLYLIFLSGIVGAHMMAGMYDWLGRYEIYLVLAEAVILLWVFREALAELIRSRRRVAIWGLILASLLVGKNQIDATVKTPVYANSTYEINYQMHRFAVEFWQDSVAVNDLGWVSFRNPYYVFDLWGLGSEQARRERRSATDLEWAERLARDRGVDLMMIFESWFVESGELPRSWEKVAVLTGRGRKRDGRATISFFLTNPIRHSEARQALEEFRPTLPDGVRLEILSSAFARESRSSSTSEPRTVSVY